ncbi:oxygenase MpaB family protein [uncultured Piscinibacter sp.]|uniref:oxygenase MpaB family protein n=1 Tax=uncultured Piscinibacter sp. TaxID=1131835 RepID=UPI00263567E7|nr:oxygenase MpaB family protein [uncultured Piscinibacter sp.]
MTHAVPDELLDRAQWQTDPLADQTMADILGPWESPESTAGLAELEAKYADHWQRIEIVNEVIARWQDNASLEHWHARLPTVPAPIADALRDYVAAARGLPDWADRAMIERAEEIFFDQGVLSCTLLFCASLPECYVVPDLAEVLHTTGQLEQRTDYRIRSTAAMVFPVMMRGGLTEPSGGGIAQVLKVRLIHAMVRNLILRRSPQEAAALRERGLLSAPVPTLRAAMGSGKMHHALFAHGWDMSRGLPCNQEEQAYTLLTFGYVYLRGLRTLGVGLDEHDERAVLHAWNVVGHLVGIRRELMAFGMPEAEALFARMQARGRAELVEPDPRPGLAGALFRNLAGVIPWTVAKPFPMLLSRRLIGTRASADLGMGGSVSLASRLLFALLLGLARVIDTVGRLFSPDFTISRLVTRVLGYHLLTKLLMDETRPLKLPQGLLEQAQAMMRDWGDDRGAPGWLNTLEDHFTVAGRWSGASRP